MLDANLDTMVGEKGIGNVGGSGSGDSIDLNKIQINMNADGNVTISTEEDEQKGSRNPALNKYYETFERYLNKEAFIEIDAKNLKTIIPYLITTGISRARIDNEGLSAFEKKIEKAGSSLSQNVIVDIGDFQKYVGHFIKTNEDFEKDRVKLEEKIKNREENVHIPLYKTFLLTEPLKYVNETEQHKQEFTIRDAKLGKNGTIDKKCIVDSSFYVNQRILLETLPNAKPNTNTVSLIIITHNPYWHIEKLLDESSKDNPVEISYGELLLYGEKYEVQRTQKNKISIGTSIELLVYSDKDKKFIDIPYDKALKVLRDTKNGKFDYNLKFKVFARDIIDNSILGL